MEPLFERLSDLDEVSLIEILDISTEELLDYLTEYVIENYEEIEDRLN